MKGVKAREEFTPKWLRKHKGFEQISDQEAWGVIETLQSYSQIVSKVIIIEQEKGGGSLLDAAKRLQSNSDINTKTL